VGAGFGNVGVVGADDVELPQPARSSAAAMIGTNRISTR
jgi:hypothetical protein